MRRFSIRTLMSAIVVSAIGLAALRNANDLWAGMMFLVALTAVGVAVMGVVILRRREQFWCAGFALFGIGYLLLAVLPWLREAFQPMLGTTYLLKELYSSITPVAPATSALAARAAITAREAGFYTFSRVGHSLFALLSGLLGGTVAAWFYTRREQADAAAREAQA
jgi:hypothetical protein